jgi:hypothetical protein
MCTSLYSFYFWKKIQITESNPLGGGGLRAYRSRMGKKFPLHIKQFFVCIFALCTGSFFNQPANFLKCKLSMLIFVTDIFPYLLLTFYFSLCWFLTYMRLAVLHSQIC